MTFPELFVHLFDEGGRRPLTEAERQSLALAQAAVAPSMQFAAVTRVACDSTGCIAEAPLVTATAPVAPDPYGVVMAQGRQAQAKRQWPASKETQ